MTKTFLGYCFITENEEEILSFNNKRAQEQGISVKQYLDNQSSLPGAWAGSPEEIASQYEHLFKMGFTHFQILFPYGKELEMSKQFAELVIRRISKT